MDINISNTYYGIRENSNQQQRNKNSSKDEKRNKEQESSAKNIDESIFDAVENNYELPSYSQDVYKAYVKMIMNKSTTETKPKRHLLGEFITPFLNKQEDISDDNYSIDIDFEIDLSMDNIFKVA